MSDGDVDVARGAVAAEVAEEFGALELYWTAARNVGGRSPEGVKDRLRLLSDRFRGAEALAMRAKPIPWAYRVFFRHIGLDPDEVRTPVEAAVLRRLRHGGLRSQGLLPDALTIATLETGVGVWALDLAACSGVLEIRLAREGELESVPEGRMVVADESGIVSELFSLPLPGRSALRDTPEVVLYAVAVPGIPDIHVEEALHTAATTIAP